VNWLFRNRRTGEITVMQRPNVPLSIFFGASVLTWIVRPHGTLLTGFSLVTNVALTYWGADELFRGVNPFRRALGVLVLLYIFVLPR
jgi:hypothetical protein